ncbi:hypothetical protein BCR37DRAFT_357864 [Protomyces lactucae-debilis]|uniref:Kinesin-like protein n=1 Tax=Protomyces lactucae-debilis TaxID=2754530 RepID=A0A1Y2FFF0_PROLT|nr:uncharacterized protein BCR37DRAFT_357864 [Protomyces lactucae-debilis]ORY82642.1 hypothetical protein BCR37DRAFT_357864 [Protomyces lactucae-debilis]
MQDSPDTGNIVVAVRVRPLNARERSRNAACCVCVDGKKTQLVSDTKQRTRNGRAAEKAHSKSFTFDHSYWSCDKSDAHYAAQGNVYEDLGAPLIEKTLRGYNCCIFAYGQTGSGKSYSMMGTDDEPGLIPLICKQLFTRIEAERGNDGREVRVEVSYLEIYSERVRDLLSSHSKGNLRVREHPSTGPYVEELSKLVVNSFDDVALLMDQGNKARTVAATAMNDTSSRSHAVFSIVVTQIADFKMNSGNSIKTEKVAKISLVDLAGSERATSTGATGARLKEGADINKSLSTLGRVIHALVEKQALPKAAARQLSVPYRDSILTWLLKDSLGGNSFTAMIATISPADISWDETLSTLRYADSAKRIKNHAVVNEDPNAKMIRELRQELEELRMKMSSMDSPDLATQMGEQMLTIVGPDGVQTKVSKAEMVERMEQSAKLMAEMNLSWEEKMRKTQEIQQERESALESLGIELSAGLIGISTPKKLPHLVNLSEDPLLTECLVYNLKPGRTRCGNVEADAGCEIKLSGSSILPVHCIFDNEGGVIHLEAMPEATVMVNGLRLAGRKRLRSGYRLIIGDEAVQVYRFNHPEEARAERLSRIQTADGNSAPATPSFENSSLRRSVLSPEPPLSGSDARPESSTSSYAAFTSESPSQRTSDYLSARKEAAKALVGTPIALEDMPDEELEQLATNLEQVKASRLSLRSRSSLLGADMLASLTGGDDYLLSPTSTEIETGYQSILRAPDITPADPEEESRLLEAQKKSERSVRSALAKWKSHRSFALAKKIREAAELVHTANAMAQQHGHNTAIQLSLAPGTLASAVSPLENDAVYDSAQSATPALESAQVLVRIMDIDKGLVCVQSLEKLQAKLSRLHAITGRSVTNRSSKDGFLDKPIPQFTLIGTAMVMIQHSGASQMLQADVYSPHTHVHAAVLHCDLAVSDFDSTKHTVKLHLRQLLGIQEREATAIHIFAYFDHEPEMCFTTKEVSGFRDGPVLLNSRHVCTVPASALPGKMHFRVWGETTREHVEKLLSWDDLQEADTSSIDNQTQKSEQHTAVLCSISIAELNTQGVYEAVDVLSTSSDDPGFFYLHQGLSRRITVSLLDNCGSQIPLSRVSRMSVSDVRLVDATSDDRRARTPGAEQVSLKLIHCGTPSAREKPSSAAAELKDIVAQWDSSVHNTAAVDRITAVGRSTRMTLQFATQDLDGRTAEWQADVTLRVFGREQQPTLFQRMFGQYRLAKSCFLVFAEAGQGAVSQSPGQLPPRGLSLLRGYEKMSRMQMNQLHLQALQAQTSTSINTPVKSSGVNPPLEEIVAYWQRRTLANLPIDYERRMQNALGSSQSRVQFLLQPISSDGPAQHAGHLSSPRHQLSKKWVRAYMVVRNKHWLLQYAHSTQVELQAVYDIRNVTQFVQEVGSATGRHRFKLLLKPSDNVSETAPLTLQFEAASEVAVQAWRKVLDPTLSC